MLRLITFTSLAVLSACVTPRSIGFGYTAQPLGKGGAEVGVALGALYQAEAQPPTSGTNANGQPTTEQITANGWSAPHFEGNAQVGINSSLGLNVHFSAAGVQPGLKWTLAHNKNVSLAVVPQFGVGFFSHRSATLVSGVDGRERETAPVTTQVLLFQPGAKVIFSHRSGFYAGIGYDLISMRRTQVSTIGSDTNGTLQTVNAVSTSVGHQLGAAIGVSAEAGPLLLKPELAVIAIPSFDTTYTRDTVSVPSSGGFAFAIFPSLTIAVRHVSKSSRYVDGEDEAEEEVELPLERPVRKKEAVPE
ncbi:MAG: hypothetical protein K1X64_13145 [Myxococcaceae bacterium]|nr:hypothetical protein [Myxococcaceae bacterium]